jgi:UDP-GlcNAc:undecaprenyl-phosphate GlcNAc-1-phosphate transferase
LIEYLTKRGVVDKPGARRINTKVIPRMGGVVIYSIIIIILFSFYANLTELRLILISSAFVIVCGIADDIVGVKWHLKFVLQFAASIFIVLLFSPLFSSIEIFGVIFPLWAGYFILTFFFVGILNAINLMDGLDGLVSGFSFQIFVLILSLAVLHHDRLLMVLCAGLLGSLLGFLKYNAYPARIFLGDTGSLILGYFLAISSIKTSLNYHSAILDLTFPIILLGIPIIDTIKVMFYRIIKGRNPFLPDKNHLHHIIFGNEVHHKHTVFIIHGITLWFICLSLFYILYKSVLVIPLFILSALCLISVKQIISFLKKYDVVIKFYNKVRNVPDYIVNAYERYFLIISTIAVASIIFCNFPTTTTLKNGELLTLIFICASLLLLAVSHNRRSKATNHIYVFFNVVVFFYLNLIKNPLNFHSYSNHLKI